MKTKELLEAIQKVMPAVDGKSIVAQTDHLIFNEGLLSAYNGRISISVPIDTEIDCSVPASDVLKIVKAINDPEVTIVYEEQLLHIESKSMRAAVSTEVEEEAALTAIREFDLDDLYDGKGKVIPVDLIEAINMCKGSASRNADDMNNLNCICIDGNYVMAGDGYKATIYEMSEGIKDKILIRLSSAMGLTDFNLTEYIIDNGWMHMIDEYGTVFSVLTQTGAYPKMREVVDNFKADLSITLPAELQSTVKVFGDIAESPVESWKIIEINILGDAIECNVEKNGVSATKTLSFEDNDVDVSFMISSVMMSQIMEQTLEMDINNSHAKFIGDKFEHLIVLVE